VAEHKIVLASVAQGSEAAVASALVEVLGLPENLTQEIARSAPIVILSGLAPEQATAVLEAMELIKQSGGNLAISAAAGESMPQVNWPDPPTVGGRGIETYSPGYVPPSAPPSPPPSAQAEATGRAAGAPAGSASLFCPHCGGAISIQISAATGGRPPSSAALPTAGVLADVPDVAGRPVPQRPPSGGSSRSGPMDLEEFEKGVGGGVVAQPKGDDLLRQLDAALPAKDPGLRALEMAAPPGPPAQPVQPAAPAQPPQSRAPVADPKRRRSAADRRRRGRRR
jgi:hypothetical protein